MNRRDFEAHLGRHGCELHHNGGKHDVWWNPATGKRASIPRHRTLARGIVRSVCRTLEVPLPDGF